MILVGLAIDQIAQSGLSSLSVIYYSAQLFSRAAMNLVTNAGIPLRVNSNYKIQHDKVIIVDGRHVETGSFNYTASAEKYNSENAIVMWDAPELAGQYLKHWQSRWNQGRDFTPSY